MERRAYEVVVVDGKFFYKQSGELLDTTAYGNDAKWIFVLSTSKILYVGKKKKGTFQHSSFLAGGATTAAGRLVVENGILKVIFLLKSKNISFKNIFSLFLLLKPYFNFDFFQLLDRRFGLTVVIIGLQNRTLKTLSHSSKRTTWI